MSINPPRGKPFLLDGQIGFLLRGAYQRASENLSARIGAHDLTPPQFAVLARLRERGKMPQNELGRAVFMEPANIRDVVQRLKKRGLVRTENSPADKRLLFSALSPEGAQLVEKIIPLDADSSSVTLAPLNARESALLRALLRRIAGAGSAPA